MKGQKVSLIFLVRLNISSKYNDLAIIVMEKMNILRFFPYKCIRNQI